jgi:glutamate racemase
MNILVFDSGIGGVSVASALRRLCPNAALTYLMDDAGFPYGEKPEAALVARVLAAVQAGIDAAQPDLVVVACNTASTGALAAVRARFSVPFVGCVPPVKSAAAASRTRVIGVLATPATASGPYLRALAEAHAPHCQVLLHGAPNLAALAERAFAGAVVRQTEVDDELAPLLSQPEAARMDAVALGCTHYAQLLPLLRARLPPHVAWLDPAEPVARQAARVAARVAAGCERAAAPGLDGRILHTGPFASGQAPGWVAAGFKHALRLHVEARDHETVAII